MRNKHEMITAGFLVAAALIGMTLVAVVSFGLAMLTDALR